MCPYVRASAFVHVHIPPPHTSTTSPHPDPLTPLLDLLQSSPVREYTCSAQSPYCTLTITAIYTTPNESHEPA